MVRSLKRALWALAGVVFMLSTVSVGTASARPAGDRQQQQPIRIVIELEFAFDGACDGGVFTPLWGRGNVTHLGRVDVAGSTCLDFSSGELREGLVSYTAANGDVLHLRFDGFLVIGTDGSLGGGGGLWVIGGTGRFASASGELTYSIESGSLTTLAGTLEGEGWITYDASDRRG